MPAEKPHILYVDDNQDTRELVELILIQAAFNVSVTADTDWALNLHKTIRFDLLLLDNRMPKLAGLDLCKRIRATDRSTPILICSGMADEELEAMRLADCQGYIRKPFDPVRLVEKVSSALHFS